MGSRVTPSGARGRRGPAGGRRAPAAARASRRCSRCAPRRSSGARNSRSQIAWFERPSAMSARTSRSRSVRSSSGTRARRRPTSWATTSGSITEPPRAIRRTASAKSSRSSTRSLSRYPTPPAPSRDQAEREASSRRIARGRGCRPRPVLRADRLRGPQALVGVRRRHPDVDDRDIRGVARGPRRGARRRRRLGRPPRSRPRRAGGPCPPAGGRNRPRATTRSVMTPDEGPDRRARQLVLGDEPEGPAAVEARPVDAALAARGQDDEWGRAVDREARGRPRSLRRRAGRCRAGRDPAEGSGRRRDRTGRRPPRRRPRSRRLREGRGPGHGSRRCHRR